MFLNQLRLQKSIGSRMSSIINALDSMLDRRSKCASCTHKEQSYKIKTSQPFSQSHIPCSKEIRTLEKTKSSRPPHTSHIYSAIFPSVISIQMKEPYHICNPNPMHVSSVAGTMCHSVFRTHVQSGRQRCAS